MFRRAFILQGLMLVGVARRVWALRRAPHFRRAMAGQAQVIGSAPQYFPLTRSVRIPLEAVKVPWQPVMFTAEAMAPATASTASRRVLISGMLFRKGIEAEQLSALCLTCPHEQCKVDLITEAARLAEMGGNATHPLFECGCHQSVFDALQEGAKISGETPRGLYRFRITDLRDGVAEISEIEETALFEV